MGHRIQLKLIQCPNLFELGKLSISLWKTTSLPHPSLLLARFCWFFRSTPPSFTSYYFDCIRLFHGQSNRLFPSTNLFSAYCFVLKSYSDLSDYLTKAYTKKSTTKYLLACVWKLWKSQHVEHCTIPAVEASDSTTELITTQCWYTMGKAASNCCPVNFLHLEHKCALLWHYHKCPVPLQTTWSLPIFRRGLSTHLFRLYLD